MKKLILTLIMSVGLVGSIAFGANKQKKRNPKVKPQSIRGVTRVKPNDNNFFPTAFGYDQTEQQARENFWKLFGTGLDNADAPAKKITHQDALAIITMMNNVSEAFNKDYSFTRLDRAQFMVTLRMFLENPKNQLVLKRLLQVLKNQVTDMPWLATCAVQIEQAINNKNAAQFWVVYSDLEGYFRELPIETRSLIRITTGWRATLKNFKDAVSNKARSAYNYIFSRKLL